MASRVKWYGDKLIATIRAETPDALFEIGEDLLEVAKSKVPVLSGDLKRSGYVTSKDRSTYQKLKTNRKEAKVSEDGVVVVAFADFKARWYEYGADGVAARPYLRPSLDERKDGLIEKLVAKIGRKLR